MKNEEPTLWGIHAGQTGDAHSLFLKHNCVALGWVKTGDLSKTASNFDAFKIKVKESYPDKTTAAVANNAGQLFRFIHEMKVGDIIIYPSKHDHEIHIGRVEGEYKYEPSKGETYPHLRPVKWLKTFPRVNFSQGAKFEVGAAMSFFQVKNYAGEFLEALKGKSFASEDMLVDPDYIEDMAGDFILKRLDQGLKGLAFEDFVAHLLNKMGYKTQLQPEGSHGIIDIIAYKGELGLEPPVKVQVKSGTGKISEQSLSTLYGKIGKGEFGLFITLSDYDKKAISFASGKSDLRLINGEAFVDLVLKYYDQFDPQYKTFLPLRRVYVPEPIEEENEE